MKFLQRSMDAYVADVDVEPGKTTIIFTLKEKAGALAETLKLFQVKTKFHQIKIMKISFSRPLMSVWIISSPGHLRRIRVATKSSSSVLLTSSLKSLRRFGNRKIGLLYFHTRFFLFSYLPPLFSPQKASVRNTKGSKNQPPNKSMIKTDSVEKDYSFHLAKPVSTCVTEKLLFRRNVCSNWLFGNLEPSEIVWERRIVFSTIPHPSSHGFRAWSFQIAVLIQFHEHLLGNRALSQKGSFAPSGQRMEC